MSKKWRLNKKDLKDIAVMAAAYLASYLLVEVIPYVDFGRLEPLIALGLPVATYALKKLQQGK